MVRTAWLSGIKKCSARVLAENGVKNVPGLQNSVSWIMDWYAVPEEYESVLMGEGGGGGMHTSHPCAFGVAEEKTRCERCHASFYVCAFK